MMNTKYRITARTYIVVVVFLLLLLTVFNIIDTLATWYLTNLWGWYIETNAMILDSVQAHGTMYGFVYPKLLFSAFSLLGVYLFVRLRNTMTIVIEKHWGVRVYIVISILLLFYTDVLYISIVYRNLVYLLLAV